MSPLEWILSAVIVCLAIGSEWLRRIVIRQQRELEQWHSGAPHAHAEVEAPMRDPQVGSACRSRGNTDSHGVLQLQDPSLDDARSSDGRVLQRRDGKDDSITIHLRTDRPLKPAEQALVFGEFPRHLPMIDIPGFSPIVGFIDRAFFVPFRMDTKRPPIIDQDPGDENDGKERSCTVTNPSVSRAPVSF